MFHSLILDHANTLLTVPHWRVFIFSRVISICHISQKSPFYANFNDTTLKVFFDASQISQWDSSILGIFNFDWLIWDWYHWNQRKKGFSVIYDICLLPLKKKSPSSEAGWLLKGGCICDNVLWQCCYTLLVVVNNMLSNHITNNNSVGHTQVIDRR